ncbi:hypothetical protein [Paenisporosarcina sp. NPDC076898]|uniref:hypothetical protein n=1 Tax=unclassified Paenisporosarcina TaxID=2642018 RepID=UPI003CFCD984
MVTGTPQIIDGIFAANAAEESALPVQQKNTSAVIARMEEWNLPKYERQTPFYLKGVCFAVKGAFSWDGVQWKHRWKGMKV